MCFCLFFVSDCCDMMIRIWLTQAKTNMLRRYPCKPGQAGKRSVSRLLVQEQEYITFFLFGKKSHRGFLVQGACGSFLLFFKRLLLLLVHECNEILQLFAEITGCRPQFTREHGLGVVGVII